MRNISDVSLAKIAQRFGAEPFLVVGVTWQVQEFYYADKALDVNIPGKLLQINSIEDVTILAGSTSTTNLSITLDDTDGSLKNIFNVLDIHRRPVAVYQCFEGIPFNEKFVIYEGLLESPIVWSDNDRTLSFSVVGMNEHKEIGFSPEEGQFPNLPVADVGVAWPMAFGSPVHCPGLTYQTPAVGTIQYPYFHLDPSLDIYDEAYNPAAPENQPTSSVTAAAVPRDSFGASGEIVNTPQFKSESDIINYMQANADQILAGNQGAINYSQHQTTVGEALSFAHSQLAKAIDHRPPPGFSSFIIDGQEYDDHDYELQFNATWSNPGPFEQPLPQANQSAYYNLPTVKEQLKAQHARSDGIQLLNNGFGFPVGVHLIIAMNNHVFDGIMDNTGFMKLKALKLPDPVPAYYPNRTIGTENITEFTSPQTHTSDGGLYSNSGGKYLSPYQQNLYYFIANGVFTPEEYAARGKPHLSGFGQAPVGWSLQQGIQSDGFQLYNAGTQITILGDYSIDYIINIFPTTVTAVWGYKAVGNVKTLSLVPSNRYSVVSVPFGTITAQIVRMNRLLSAYPGENWEDGIYVDQTSSIGPNPADIIAAIINTYSPDLGIDENSFAVCRALLVNYPMNFTLSDKPEILGFLQDLAYQCRCAIYIKNQVFFMQYLSAEFLSGVTITIDDVLEGTIQVTTSETEQIITRLSGHYFADYATGVESQVIVRNNVNRYGLFKDDHTFFAYTNGRYVQKSVTYWVIIRSNVWKKLKFSTPLHLLNLETFDLVVFDISGIVANVPVTCRIESTQYDSANNKIDFECWVPVRLGEMLPYQFAYPAESETDFSDIYLQQFDGNFQGDFRQLAEGTIATVPGQESNSVVGGGSDIGFDEGRPTYGDINQTTRDRGEPRPSDRDDTIVAPRVTLEKLFDPVKLPDGAEKPNYTPAVTTRVKPLKLNVLPVPACIPGVVQGSQGGGKYNVTIYPQGMSEDPKTVVVQQLQIRADEQIPVGTYVLVSAVCIDKSGDENKITFNYTYYMQVPVWLGQPEA